MTNDRRSGALVGAIVGDLIGIPFEFARPEAIPVSRLTVRGGGPFDFAPGVGSDDTDLLLNTIDAYAGDGYFDAYDALAGMLAWFANDPRDVGSQTASSLMRWADDHQPERNENAQGNGGLMRAAAHGIMSNSMFKARRHAVDDTRLTHPSGMAEACSAVQAMMVWRLLNTQTRDMRSVIMPGSKIDLLYRDRLTPYDEDISDRSGHCVHSLRLAMHVLCTAKSYEEGITRVVRTGGDTDTNAAIAGALLGARFGLSGIPKDWRDAMSAELKDRVRKLSLTPVKIAA